MKGCGVGAKISLSLRVGYEINLVKFDLWLLSMSSKMWTIVSDRIAFLRLGSALFTILFYQIIKFSYYSMSSNIKIVPYFLRTAG